MEIDARVGAGQSDLRAEVLIIYSRPFVHRLIDRYPGEYPAALLGWILACTFANH